MDPQNINNINSTDNNADNNENNKLYGILGSILLIVVIVIAVFFSFLYLKQKKVEPVILPIATSTSGRKEIPEPDMKISRYILGAKVTAVDGRKLNITLQRLFAGPKGNYVDTDNKTVQLSTSTEIVFGKLVNKKYSESPALITDIKVGQSLIFYSSENIKLMDTFSPYKVIINQ